MPYLVPKARIKRQSKGSQKTLSQSSKQLPWQLMEWSVKVKTFCDFFVLYSTFLLCTFIHPGFDVLVWTRVSKVVHGKWVGGQCKILNALRTSP